MSQEASTSYHVASGGSCPTPSLFSAIPEVLSLMTSLGMSGLKPAEPISGPWDLLFRGVRVQSRLDRLTLTLLPQEGNGLVARATALSLSRMRKRVGATCPVSSASTVLRCPLITETFFCGPAQGSLYGCWLTRWFHGR